MMPSMRDPTPPARLTGRELLGCAALGVLLAVALHWPLALHLGDRIAQDLGDPLVQAWQVAWDGHALAHQPLRFFQANQFWPLPDSLAFSDALVGYAPAGLIGSGVHAAVARYDVLFLLAYALCFAGAWLLARELGAGRVGAVAAGAAFAFAPWRLEQEGHLHVISSGGIALALFGLVRGYRRQSAPTILAGWLVATWQFSLGFSLGLPLIYLLGLGTIATLGVWWQRGRPRQPRRVLLATAAGMLCFAVVAVALARPYLRVLDTHPEARRSAVTVAIYSPPPRAFLAASGDSRVWSAATRPVRNSLNVVPEKTLFPGLAILALAFAGWRFGVFERRLRTGLAAATVAVAILSLGFQLGAGSWLFPYRLLYELLPGWQGIRVPARLHTFTTLLLALLAAAGAQALYARARGRWGAGAAAAVAAVLVIAILAEGWGFADHPSVPPATPGFSRAPQPALHLPMDPPGNRRYVLWSTDGFPKLVNGRAGFYPRQFRAVQQGTARFPDARSAAFLRKLGVRSVTVHLDRARGTALARRASSGSLRGLDLERHPRGRVVLFLLR
jgi:hypothetical protein